MLWTGGLLEGGKKKQVEARGEDEPKDPPSTPPHPIHRPGPCRSFSWGFVLIKCHYARGLIASFQPREENKGGCQQAQTKSSETFSRGNGCLPVSSWGTGRDSSLRAMVWVPLVSRAEGKTACCPGLASPPCAQSMPICSITL